MAPNDNDQESIAFGKNRKDVLKMNTVMRMYIVFLLSVLVMSCLLLSTNDNIVFANVKTGIEVGQKASGFKLLTTDNKGIELETFSKNKVTLLVFGATWCHSCRNEVSDLKGYYNELKDKGLKLISVDIQENKKAVVSFIEKFQINYPVALDTNGSVARQYNIVGIPLNIVMDKNGVIRYKEHSPPGKKFLLKLLED